MSVPVEEVLARTAEYISSCAAERNAKGRGRFPNLAGLCRALGVGVEAFRREMEAYPEVLDAVCAMLEDEALNWECSATLVSAYLKKHLGYDGTRGAERRGTVCEAEEVRLVFEHDVFEDGG